MDAIRYAFPVNPFSTAFTRGMAHGIVAAVHLPEPSDEHPDAFLQQLHVDEQHHARQLSGKRQIEWVGGRIAARNAAQTLGVDLPPLLPDGYGAPVSPPSLTISISHKAGLAMALVARKVHGLVGIDFEVLGRDRSEIASKVLNPFELAEVNGLVDERRWTAVLLRFSIKEALYKALAPRLQRYIGFEEAQVSSLANGSARVELTLKEGENPAHAEVKYEWIADGLVATARVRWE